MTARFARTAGLWLTTLTLLIANRLDARDEQDRDRGDVPGWVMITVMTAIVVIALLAVFRDQVTTAVENAFSKVNKGYDK